MAVYDIRSPEGSRALSALAATLPEPCPVSLCPDLPDWGVRPGPGGLEMGLLAYALAVKFLVMEAERVPASEAN